MRRPPCLLMLALAGIGIGVGACGGAYGGAGKAASAAHAALRQRSPFLNDGDFDNGDGDPDNNRDTDADAPFDYSNRTNQSWNRGIFHDRDDTGQLSVGQSAGSAETHAVSEVVTRYYHAAARHDGRRACAMLLPSIARRMVDYSQTGIPYLRGSRTCQEAMGRLFRHSKLRVPQVTSVRIQGAAALAFWGSRTMPAGYITLLPWHGTWAIVAPAGNQLF